MKKENSRMANLTLRMVLRMMHALALLLVFLPSRAFATSFVCAKAKTQVEKFICASPSLSELDDAVHSAYIAARKADATGAITSQQRAWLKERNACTTPECVENLYNRRLEQLGQQYNPSSSIRRIGL